MEHYGNKSNADLILEIEKYKILFENSPLAYQSLDTKGNILDINPAWLKKFGYNRKEVIGKFIGDFLHPDFLPVLKEQFAKFLKQGYIHDAQFKIRHKKGHDIYISNEGCISYFPDGKIKQTYCIFTDITEQKKTEELIIESESNLNALINNREESIWSLDKSLNYLTFNRFFAKSYFNTYHIELKKGMNAINILSPDLKTFWLSKYKTALNGQKLKFEFSADINNKIQYYNVNLNPIVSNGKVIGLSSISTDITERKEVENKLDLYKKIIEESRDAVAVIDKEGYYIEQNKAHKSLIGFSDEELSGKTPAVHFGEDVFSEIAEELSKEGFYRKELISHTKSGDIDLDLSAFSVFNEAGDLLCHVGIKRDISKQKQFEKTILDRDEEIRSIFRAAPIGIGVVKNRIITQVNTRFCEICGYSEEELIHKNAEIVYISKEEYDLVGKVKYKQIQKFGTGTVETKFKHKSGKIIDVLLSSTLLDISNLDKGVTFTALDITDRKRNSEILKIQNAELVAAKKRAEDSEQNTKTQLNNNDFLRQTASHFVNDTFESDIYSYIGKTLNKLIPSAYIMINEVDNQNIKLKGIFGWGKMYQKIINLFSKNFIGKSFPYDENLIDFSEGTLKKFEGNTRKQFLNSLSETVSKSVEKLFNIGNIYGIACVDNNLVFSNAIIFFTKGNDFEEFETVEIFIKQASLALKRKKAETELNDYKNQLEELVKERTAEIEKKAKKIEESQKAMQFLLEDVNSARKELKNINLKLIESNKDLESFAYSVSHDLKSPIRAINGYTNVLFEDFPDVFTGEKKEFLDLIVKNSVKMNMLIDGLLRFSRASRNELDKSTFDLSILVKDVINNQKELYPNFVILEKIQSDMTVNADITALKQVLINLIGNAVKFSSKNKNIKIDFGTIRINDKKTYYIKDYGVGFDMKYKDKLFEVFQRLHSNDEFEGTGIGLSLVKRIINKHGGEIWAESEIGEGSTFYFTL